MKRNRQNNKIAWLLIRVQLVAVLIFAAAAWVIIPDQFKKGAERDAVITATTQVKQVKQLRTYYSENVVRKVVDSKTGMMVSHDHKNKPKTVPIPASFIHDIGDVLQDRSFNLSFYSPYPFTNRQGRKMDEFGNAAWQSLSTQSSKAFVKSEEKNGRTTIRIAVADTLSKQLCVSCHNSHPLSSKSDWKLGDLRGILEISKDITDLIDGGKSTGRYLALALIIIFGSITILSYKKIQSQINLWSDKLAQSENDLVHAQSIAHVGSWNLDIQSNKLIWSDEIYRIFGVEDKEASMTYESFLKHIHPADKQVVQERFEKSKNAVFQYDIEHRIIRESDGEVRWVHERCTHKRDNNGEVIRSAGTVQDITERKQAENEIKRLAMTDQLTGLANRNRFHQRFDDSLILAHRERKPLALLLIDLDKFKNVNDTYGHIVGDDLLKVVAEIFKDATRKTDLVARLGGDEFAIILVHPDNKEATELCANRIIEKIGNPISIKEHNVKIGASIGIAMFPDDMDSLNSINEEDSLMHKADVALYKSKNIGRNRLTFYSPELEGK